MTSPSKDPQDAGRPRALEIVCPTDFSPAAAEALEAGATLARHRAARLSVVHVVAHRRDRAAAEARLREFAAAHAAEIPVTTEVMIGFVPHEIAEVARRRGADLILLGTHGRPSDSLVPLSVAQQLQIAGPCPVLASDHFYDVDVDQFLDGLRPPTARERRCLVCTRPAAELICPGCRARIRGEILERRRRRDEWPGYGEG